MPPTLASSRGCCCCCFSRHSVLYLQASACELPPSAKLRYYYTAFFSFNWLAFACLRPPRYAQSSVATTYKYVDPAARTECCCCVCRAPHATAHCAAVGHTVPFAITCYWQRPLPLLKEGRSTLNSTTTASSAVPRQAARRGARCLSKDDSLLELSDDLDAKEN